MSRRTINESPISQPMDDRWPSGRWARIYVYCHDVPARPKDGCGQAGTH